MSIVVKDGNGASQTIQTLPGVGQAAGASSLPVVLASDSNHATASNITTLSTAITGALAPVGGLPVSMSGTVAVTQSGTWTVALAANATVALAGGNTVALKVDGSAVTQPVSGTVTVGSLPAIPTGSNAIGSVIVSNLPATQAVSAAALPLPAGAAKDTTVAAITTALGSPLQAGGNVQVLNLPTVGPKTAAQSLPVAISTDGVIATAYGTLADAATPDITATGASFTFASLYKGMVANLLAISGKLPASLGPKAKASALAITTATDDPVLAAVAATGPGTDAFAITPSDATNFTTNARSIYVGGAGDVTIFTPANNTITFKAVPVGSILPVQAKRVNATATTATNLVGLL